MPTYSVQVSADAADPCYYRAEVTKVQTCRIVHTTEAFANPRAAKSAADEWLQEVRRKQAVEALQKGPGVPYFHLMPRREDR